MAVALANVKTALGISASVYDVELTALIASAEADLKLSGIVVYEATDPLIVTAVTAYCQANRGTDVDKRQKYAEMYKAQKRNLMLASEYTEVVVEA
ncbi:DNA-packaging protein [Oscillibacter sp.]|uniref:phage head-tail connector protein n=1 Tax=Oscillibacter sp. TaxID=1945593 RepID=UPI002898D24A|nr:DNA-packaging protein [Oscillibacter sp.]